MNTRTCEHCEGGMALALRAHAKYCSKSCRVMASRARKAANERPAPMLPQALTAIPRWVRRTASKVPLNARTGDVASSVDPRTWSTHADAQASSYGAGLGFVLSGDGICCVDLDHCLSPDGSLSAAAERFLSTLPPTYTEVSPSGDGLHVWGRGVYLTSRKLRGELKGEVIGARKYATVTGIPFRSAPSTLADIARPVGALLK